MNELTIVIPCYNEAHSLPELLKQMGSLKTSCRFILVDNGSTDGTSSILKMSTLSKNINYVTKKVNSGYGAGIKFGVKNVKTKLVGWMHGDLQQDLSILSKIDKQLDYLMKYENKNLLGIKGLRTGRSFFENIFTMGVSITASLLFFRKCWDIAGQPNIYKTKDLEFLESAPDDHNFEFFVYVKLKMINGKLLRFNAPFQKRRFGESSWDKGFISKIIHSKNIFLYLLKLRMDSISPHFR